MFVSLALLLAAQQISIPLGKPPRQIERPKAPIGETGPLWAATCTDEDSQNSKGWDKPAPPVGVHANTFLVGTCGISAILITGSAGHILIDGGTERGAELIADNIRHLGFKLRDVRYIVHSHEHLDHVGGIARLQQLTGATLIASVPAARVFATGAASPDDPQAGLHKPFRAATVGRTVGDGDTVRIGDVILTAIATPGHTAGALSWRWESCHGNICRTMIYADSLSPVSRDDYRFTDHPAALAAFRGSIAQIAAVPCDILLTPHPAASAMRTRLAAGKPLLDPDGCRAYAASLTTALDTRLGREAAK